MEFIFSKNNVLSQELCEKLITQFEDSPELYTKYDGFNGVDKKSTDIIFNQEYYQLPQWNEILNQTLDSLNKGLTEYIQKFDVLNHVNRFELTTFNMQRYFHSEGFYGWHCERDGRKEYMNRMLVWMFYLNDVKDGGTEFLYQKHKIEAEQGKLVIWPAEWTHTHRGVISNNQTKYILTGWFGYRL